METKCYERCISSLDGYHKGYFRILEWGGVVEGPPTTDTEKLSICLLDQMLRDKKIPTYDYVMVVSQDVDAPTFQEFVDSPGLLHSEVLLWRTEQLKSGLSADQIAEATERAHLLKLKHDIVYKGPIRSAVPSALIPIRTRYFRWRMRNGV